MKTPSTLELLTTRLLEIRRIQSAASVLSWDQETYMPAGGGTARAEQIATLEGLAHQKLVCAEIEALLTEWIDPATGLAAGAWDEPSRSLLRETWRDFSRAKKTSVRVRDPPEPRVFPVSAGLGNSAGREPLCKIFTLAEDHTRPQT